MICDEKSENRSHFPTLMVVDDDDAILDSVKCLLRTKEWNVIPAKTGREALRELDRRNIDLVLADIVMPGMDGISLLNQIKRHDRTVDVVIMTANSSEEHAILSLKAGALDYLRKPIKAVDLFASLSKSRIPYKKRFASCTPNQNPELFRKSRDLSCGHSSATISVLMQLEKIAKVAPNATVLFTGESGVGKEIMARMLHKMNKKSNSPFEAINCGGISESLLERELFGHERGAFSGADKRSPGIFEMGIGGTILLDEVTEMSLNGQSRFLRVLEGYSFKRVGGATDIYLADTRIIATTNRDMRQLVNEGRFREDLYYRLNIIPVNIQPLRERVEDIIFLANIFLRETIQDRNISFSKEACKCLSAYDYPGNVRELKNIVLNAAIFRSGDVILKSDLTFSNSLTDKPYTRHVGGNNSEQKQFPTSDFDLIENEINLIRKSLSLSSNNLSKAAKILGLSVQALYRRIKKHNILCE